MLLLLQHALLFFLHHCELPSLDHHNIIDGENALDLPLQHPAPQLPFRLQPQGFPDAPEEESAPHVQDPHVHHEDDEVPVEQLDLERFPEGHLADMEEDERSTSRLEEDTLMRPQLHRTSTEIVAAIVPSQESGQELGQQQLPNDEELRKIRLQHFDKRI